MSPIIELQQHSGDANRPVLTPEYLHELRTPLNLIIGYSELLAEQAGEEGQDSFVPDLQKIHAAGHRLLALLTAAGPSLQSAPDGGVAPSTNGLASAMLPELQPRQAADPVPLEVAPALILVVDDNEANRDVLSQRLKRQGHQVAMAVDGHEAMAAVRTRAFDLVLLDIMMPEIDGYEVLRQLKADAALRPIPVIMISALDELDSVVRCIEMGAEDYLPKPFNPILLKARIDACLAKKRSHDRELKLFAQLNKNYERLKVLEKLRDDLTNMIVHDMRTPLTSVIVGLQTFDMAGDVNDDQREMLDIALYGGNTLLGMINNLLDVEKLESGAMQLDYGMHSVTELVNSVSSQVASLVANRKLTLVRQIAPGLPQLRADESKLSRILVNLLGNAIKFTPSGGEVTLEAHLDEVQQCMAFSITDTGEGIPPEAFEQIFEKFGQVESRQGGRHMSTGLGLTFCKLAVEAHGGQIAVESPPGQGSTFRFTIPLTFIPENEKSVTP